MRKFKIRLAVISLIAVILSLFMQETLAYYSTIGKSSNVVTSGNLKMMIHEKTDQGNDFPAEGVYIMPGDVVSKRVTIENICEHPLYWREFRNTQRRGLLQTEYQRRGLAVG